VWDARDEEYQVWPDRAEAEHWVHDRHIIDLLEGPRQWTYRLEFWIVDVPFVKAFRYTNFHQLQPDTVEETIIMDELLPDHLMGGSWLAASKHQHNAVS